jgi:HSP20 family protein
MSDIIRRSASDVPEQFRRLLQGDLGSWLPVEEYQDGDTKVIRAELPGVNPDRDVDITVEGNVLTIEARREERAEQKSHHGYHSEFHYGSFTRSFQLPVGVSEEEIHASYSDGILEIRIPAPGQEQDIRRKIQVGRGGAATRPEQTAAAPASAAPGAPPASESEDKISLAEWQLLCGTARVARSRRFQHGWPNFEWTQPAGSPMPTFGTYLLPLAPWVHWEDVPRHELGGNPSRTDVGPMVCAANRWARSRGHKTALPTFEEADYNDGRGTVYGMVIFHSDSPVVFHDIDQSELEGPGLVLPDGKCDHPGGTWRAVSLWAYHHGYFAGFPTFEAADYGQGMVYGAHLIPAESPLAFEDVGGSEICQALGVPLDFGVRPAW